MTLGTDTSITIGNRLFTVSVPTTSSGFLLEGGSASQDAGELTISSFTNATIQNDRPVSFQIDGEYCGLESKLIISISNQKMKVAMAN